MTAPQGTYSISLKAKLAQILTGMDGDTPSIQALKTQVDAIEAIVDALVILIGDEETPAEGSILFRLDALENP